MAAVEALIVGGGVGGLTAGLALQRSGASVEVYERAAGPRLTGAGLWLWPNALVALRYLGLDGLVDSVGSQQVRSEIRDHQGRRLATIVPRDRAGKVLTSVAVWRPAVLAVLADALGPEVVRYGRRAARVTQDGTGVALQLTDGTVRRAEMLVGADGVNSVVRASLFGATPARDAGFTAWRAVTRPDRVPECGQAYWGCGVRFGFMPLGGGRASWFASTAEPPAAAPSGRERQSLLLRRFGGWPDDVTGAIAATEPDDIAAHRIHYRPPPARWGAGRIALVGDAAHAMTPSLGQGACQAIEDAVVLGRALGARDEVADALALYAALRGRRAGAVGALSVWIDAGIQRRSPIACAARDLVLRAVPDALRSRLLAWLWRFEPGGD